MSEMEECDCVCARALQICAVGRFCLPMGADLQVMGSEQRTVQQSV
jgi:hypothetical protein